MKKIKLFLIPIIFILLFVILKFNLKGILDCMPSCIYYDNWHIYCIGCGNTRAVRALLKGDIILSLRCNPIIITFVIFGFLYYLESLFNKKILPRNKIFWTVIVALFSFYYIARNFIPFFKIPVF